MNMIGFLPLDEQRKLRLAEREARRGVMVDRAEAKRQRKAKRRSRNAKEQAYQTAKARRSHRAVPDAAPPHDNVRADAVEVAP